MNDKHPERLPAVVPVYQICVEEPLDQDWSDWFDGLAITPLPAGGTMLHGPVTDQAALHGLLNKIHHLNLTLLSVFRIEEKTMQAGNSQRERGGTSQE